jgi:hypothetical protein
MALMAKQIGTEVEEPVDQLFQRLPPEVSPIPAHIEATIASSSSTHAGGEQEKHLELVGRKTGGDIDKALQERGPGSG